MPCHAMLHGHAPFIPTLRRRWRDPLISPPLCQSSLRTCPNWFYLSSNSGALAAFQASSKVRRISVQATSPPIHILRWPLLQGRGVNRCLKRCIERSVLNMSDAEPISLQHDEEILLWCTVLRDAESHLSFALNTVYVGTVVVYLIYLRHTPTVPLY